MIVGLSILVYMTIKSSRDESDVTSDALKKLLVNFLHITSLAAGLPLEWPLTVEQMFEWFNTMASAGTNLLIPDCELSEWKTAEVFYGKQIFFVFFTPLVVLLCITVWAFIYVCSPKNKIKKKDAKSFSVLSSVLMVFLAYPMLARSVFSMLNCPRIGGRGDDRISYLAADLQEPCLVGRHKYYLLCVTLPQMLVYILGLPIAAVLFFRRHRNQINTNATFRIRYGVIYFGYRRDRAWWEAVVAARKIAVILIGTVGTLTDSVNLQA